MTRLKGARADSGGRRRARREAGPVRKSVEVIVSGLAGMALVAILIAVLHAHAGPSAQAAVSPSPLPSLLVRTPSPASVPSQ
ncbi:MAG: hypothetical protein ACRDSS_15365, partial [Actinocrinis sp.]